MPHTKIPDIGEDTLIKRLPKGICHIAFVGVVMFVSCLGVGSWPTRCKAVAAKTPVSRPSEPSAEFAAIARTEPVTDTRLFNGNVAYSFALDQCEMGPRPAGSPQGWALGDYIIQHLQSYDWSVSTQEFTYKDVQLRNIIGSKGTGPLLLLGAHYDTRPIADKDTGKPQQPIIGANDGASGVAILLEMARILDECDLNWQVRLTFFDAEDRGRVDEWPYALGAEYMANHLTERPQYMILVDMVGDLHQDIYWETNSDPELLQEIWDVASQLGYDDYFIPEPRWGVTDDHTPFIKLGIPAVDLIDFDYPYWHTTDDTCDKIGPASLERVGRVIQKWLLDAGSEHASNKPVE
jgi:glutaminyl-peptide cyclotransferase